MAVDELHRIFQPAIAVHDFARRGAFGAMRAAVERRLPGGFLADPHAVSDFRRHGAADRTKRADALADGGLRAETRRRPRLRIAHAGERQCTERGEAASHKARAAQEGAAIEAAFSIGLWRACQRAAAGLTFRSLDQHGCLLTSPDSG